MKNLNDISEDLTLMLLYLHSWREKGFEDSYLRSWKGYDFNTLKALNEKEYVLDNRKAKSVHITDEGIEEAKKLFQKYGIDLEK